MGLYLGSSLLLIVAIAWLFYSSQTKQRYELTMSKMEINASNITHQIIQSHMQNKSFTKNDIIIDKDLKYGLYDNNKKVIYSQFNDNINFEKKSYTVNANSFYINDGSVGHLGVYYVVIKESNLYKEISSLLNTIIFCTIILYIILSIVGFFLAKLFIFPIQNQREKLNNFIKDTTHELNTPLTALLLCVDSENFYNEENRNHIKLSVKKMSNLYKDLTYLFLQEHQISKVLENDISKILKNELLYHTQLAAKKNISIKSYIDKTTLNITEEDFIRLINNLMSNAIKYTKRNGIIELTLKNKILLIKDNGIGIAKDKLNKIFERYYRATQSVGGFGIGLNIVNSICTSYNIKIDVESQVDVGTTFTLNFQNLV